MQSSQRERDREAERQRDRESSWRTNLKLSGKRWGLHYPVAETDWWSYKMTEKCVIAPWKNGLANTIGCETDRYNEMKLRCEMTCSCQAPICVPYLLGNIRSGYLDAWIIPPHLTINQFGLGRKREKERERKLERWCKPEVAVVQLYAWWRVSCCKKGRGRAR